ncbi:MAG TPA: hypothetical protein VGQ57_13205, partial [Polyangiaceae bacterium]|nr:hypothetical protein [Polyangiaceae bacterium]
FANEQDLGQRAVVELAPGSQSWQGNRYARFELEHATGIAVAPLFLLEPMNDHSIDPTIRLAEVAGDHCRQYQSLLFPAYDVTNDAQITTADYQPESVRDDAHKVTMRSIDPWAAAVRDFLARTLAAPAKFDNLCRATSHDLDP